MLLLAARTELPRPNPRCATTQGAGWRAGATWRGVGWHNSDPQRQEPLGRPAAWVAAVWGPPAQPAMGACSQGAVPAPAQRIQPTRSDRTASSHYAPLQVPQR